MSSTSNIPTAVPPNIMTAPADFATRVVKEEPTTSEQQPGPSTSTNNMANLLAANGRAANNAFQQLLKTMGPGATDPNAMMTAPAATATRVVKEEPTTSEQQPGPSTSTPNNLASLLGANGAAANNALQQLLKSMGPGATDQNAMMLKLFQTAITNQAAAATATTPSTAATPASALVTPKPEPTTPAAEAPKRIRLKVFSNGFFMTFDKVSSCGTKHFWRCEYKNTCKARMHTDVANEKIDSFIHEHNHPGPTDEEIELYNLDPKNIIRNKVYVVNPIADPTQRRRIRKQVQEQEAAAKRLEQQQQHDVKREMTAANIAAAQEAYARVMANASGASTSSAGVPNSTALPLTANPSPATAPLNQNAMFLAQLPFMREQMMQATVAGQQGAQQGAATSQPPAVMSPNLPMPSATNRVPPTTTTQRFVVPGQPQALKRPLAEHIPKDDDLTKDPLFKPTFEIASKLRKLWKGEPRRVPRNCDVPTDNFIFYIAIDNGTDEHDYFPIQILQRDEFLMKDALEVFCGRKCEGLPVFSVSPKITVLLNKAMIRSWENGQFFLLDLSQPNRWQLTYVDDQAV